jgi:hypothetical protein
MVRQRAGAYIFVEAQVALCLIVGVYVLMPMLGVESATISAALAWGVCFAILLGLTLNPRLVRAMTN